MRNMEFNQTAGFYLYKMFLVTNVCCINLYPATYHYIYQVSKWQDKHLVSWETFSLASELRMLLHCKLVLLLVWSSNVSLFSDDLLLIWSKNVSCEINCTALSWKRFLDCCSFFFLFWYFMQTEKQISADHAFQDHALHNWRPRTGRCLSYRMSQTHMVFV